MQYQMNTLHKRHYKKNRKTERKVVLISKWRRHFYIAVSFISLNTLQYKRRGVGGEEWGERSEGRGMGERIDGRGVRGVDGKNHKWNIYHAISIWCKIMQKMYSFCLISGWLNNSKHNVMFWDTRCLPFHPKSAAAHFIIIRLWSCSVNWSPLNHNAFTHIRLLSAHQQLKNHDFIIFTALANKHGILGIRNDCMCLLTHTGL